MVALIGERAGARIPEHELGEDGRAQRDRLRHQRQVLDGARQGGLRATAIAEYFRDQGKKVLFLMDSVTRRARAQRDRPGGRRAADAPGLSAVGVRTLPRLMERVGMNDKGSITALYTVLVEGDDMTEPVADETRSILDGHIVLSRRAASNHYPAIDAGVGQPGDERRASPYKAAAGRIRELMAKYQEVELLVKIGEY